MNSRTNRFLGTGFVLLCFCILGFQIKAPAEWQKPLQPSLTGGPLTCLAPHPLDPQKFLAASGHDVFEGGRENPWKTLWSQTDPRSAIKRLFSFPELPDHIFVLTQDKLFLGNLKDHSWRMVYKDTSRIPLSFALHPKDPNHWFLGTQKGLWETENAGKTWSPSKNFGFSGPVPLISFDETRLFIATENTLYLSPPESVARQVLSLSGTETDSFAEEDSPAEEDTSVYAFKIHDLLAAKDNPPKLFLATQKGVFESQDHGSRWEPLTQSGLQSPVIRQLAWSQKGERLYAATPRGVYSYAPQEQRWSEIFKGLAGNQAQSIAVLHDEKLLAITNEGFVQYPLGTFTPEANPSLRIYQPPEERLLLFKDLVAAEPSAREIQKKVILYADIGNGKIKRWHASSRLAALLPSFSFGKSLDRGASLSTYSGKYITGPEDVNKGWDADVSWDLGETLYSSAQTSIDSREKMMVELRNDLLSEATRIYYERRRLQIDLVFTPPASEQEHLENLLRMDELATLLDGMTDGFFSKRLEQLYAEKPEFQKLWGFTQEGVGSTAYGDKQQNKEI